MTAFTGEVFSKVIAASLKNNKGNAVGRIVNRQFFTEELKADKANFFMVDKNVDGEGISNTISIPLDTQLEFETKLPEEAILKSEFDLIKGFTEYGTDEMVIQKNEKFLTTISSGGNAVTGGTLTIDTLAKELASIRRQMVENNTLNADGTYSFMSIIEVGTVPTFLTEPVFKVDGKRFQIKWDIGYPFLVVSPDVYQLIVQSLIESNGHAHINNFSLYFGGFEIIVDSDCKTTAECDCFAITHNCVAEAFTAAKIKEIDDQDEFAQLLKGILFYGCVIYKPENLLKVTFESITL